MVRKQANRDQEDVGRNYIYELENDVYFDGYNYGDVTRFFNGTNAAKANVVAEREFMALASFVELTRSHKRMWRAEDHYPSL